MVYLLLKFLIYNAKWMELVILLLTLNLIGNIFKHKLYRREKTPVFMFHISFIVIIFGSAITRYIGYEGQMKIREGDESNVIISSDIYLQVKIDDQVQRKVYPFPLMPNNLSPDYFETDIDFKETDFTVNYHGYLKNAIDTIVEVEGGADILEIVTTGHNGRESVYIESGKTEFIGQYPVSFNDDKFYGGYPT